MHDERGVESLPEAATRAYRTLIRGRSIAVLIGAVLLLPPACSAQAPESRNPPHSERAWIASKVYAVTSQNFAHWEGVPQLDLDDWYKEYLGNAMQAEGRREFSLASMEFIAGLRNGHSNFYDRWLSTEFGHPLGFSLRLIEGRWIVADSRLEALAKGEVVVRIDGEPFDEFFTRQKRYVSASSESERARRFFYMPYLFPESFQLGVQGGKRHSINRRTQKLQSRSNQSSPQPRVLEDGIAYLPIKSFAGAKFEQNAIDFITEHHDAKTLIIDVRGNGGGSTPVELVKALMDRPWREWTSATPYRLALGSAHSQIRSSVPPYQLGEYARGYVDALSGMGESMLVFPSRLNPPERPKFTNDLIVLVDERCFSACEDFVMPLKFSGRAVLIGQSTAGSSGEPYMYDFGNGMRFRISTKRQYFPDGSTFEGVGIVPDIEVPITIDSIVSEADEILVQAMEIARANRR